MQTQNLNIKQILRKYLKKTILNGYASEIDSKKKKRQSQKTSISHFVQRVRNYQLRNTQLTREAGLETQNPKKIVFMEKEEVSCIIDIHVYNFTRNGTKRST